MNEEQIHNLENLSSIDYLVILNIELKEKLIELFIGRCLFKYLMMKQ